MKRMSNQGGGRDDDDSGLTDEVRRQLWTPLGIGATFVVVFWAAYLGAALFDKDLLKGGAPAGSFTTGFYLGTAVLVTVIVAVVCWRIVRRGLTLIERGVRVDARFVDVGGVGGHGQMPVTFAYTVGGRRYTVTEAVDIDVINEMGPDTVVGVMYDPRDPSKATLLRSELPTPAEQSVRETVAEGARDVAWHAIEAAVFFGVFLGSLAVLFLAIRSMDLPGDDDSPVKTAAAVLAAGLAFGAVTGLEQWRGGWNWRLRKVRRNLWVAATVLTVGGAVWMGVAYSSARERGVRRREDAAQQEQLREMTRKAEAAGRAYQEWQERRAGGGAATRPAGSTRAATRPGLRR